MSSIPLVRSTTLRCAPFHESTGADPCGSAGHHDAFLCVEVPLPWGRDISEHEPFRALGAGASITGVDGRSWRPQGLVPVGDTGTRTRVLAMEQPGHGGPVGPYRRREWWVAPERVAELCTALVGADDGAIGAFDPDRVSVASHVVDLFVCTHGRRDVCCGGSGTVLHDELAEVLAGDDTVRLFRVSHTGGHRFAPTALTFPDGLAWAHLDRAAATAVLRRHVAPASLAAHCRGSSSVGGPAEQVADREALVRVGWAWCDATRTVTATAPTGDDRRSEVRVDGVLPDGARLVAMVQVELEREIPQPTCGDPIDDSGAPEVETPMAPVWRAALVDRLPDD